MRLAYHPRPVIVNHLMSPVHFDNVQGIIFDVDGVLFDSYGANQRFYNLILERLGLPPMTPSQEHYVHMHAVGASVAHIVPRERLPEADKVRADIDYGRDIMPFMVPEPGLYELLQALTDEGVPLSLNTNRTTTLEMVAAHFGLTRYFWPRVSAAMVTPKPHPEGIHRILELWGMEPDEVAYIGDSSLDEQASRRAGLRFWAYKNTALKGDLYIPDFWVLREVLIRALRQQWS